MAHKIKSRPIIALFALALCCWLLAACGGGDMPAAENSVPPVPEGDTSAVTSVTPQSNPDRSDETISKSKEDNIMIEITMENGGVIKLELDSAAAPITVQNFVDLVNDGFYDGLIFHRIIDGFMIQGGDPTGTGMGGPGHQIKGEFSANGWENPITHERGVISMARSQDFDSAGSQFFIVNGDSDFLDGNYAAFGKVLEGMDVVDAIAAADKDSGDRPVEDQVITTIRVVD